MDKNLTADMEKMQADLPFLIREMVDFQYELQPEFHSYGAAGLQHAVADANYNLGFLFSAVAMDSLLLFKQYNLWTQRLFDHLKMPNDSLRVFYRCASRVFQDRFQRGQVTESFHLKMTEYLDAAEQILKTTVVEEVSSSRANNPLKAILSQYSDYVHAGNRLAATRLIQEASCSGMEIRNLYKYVFQPFQLELGELWFSKKISVAQEHYATAVSQIAMSLLYDKIFTGPKNGKRFLGTCSSGELHEFGIRMICDYMESNGWSTCYLGANMPGDAILDMIHEFSPDIVAVSCTMIFNLPKARDLILKIKSTYPSLPVIAGGYPFNLDDKLWMKIGAEAYGANFEDTLSISESLVSGRKS